MKQKRYLSGDDLHEIRNGVDWKEVFLQLGMTPVPKSEDEWYAISPFARNEETPSFHMKTDPTTGRGIWKCFSTDQKGGGAIELVQRVLNIDCYTAGRWILDQGLYSLQADSRGRNADVIGSPAKLPPDRKPEKKVNLPIRQSLLHLLETDHLALAHRNIPESVLKELGIGYLPETSKKPLAGRIVFQVRGLDPELNPVILSHVGRAVSAERARDGGKWRNYSEFHTSVELYNIDMVVLDAAAREQAKETGHVVVVEGCFDAVKLWAAGIRNVVATFGSALGDRLDRYQLIGDQLGIDRFLFFYDRDEAGESGTLKAMEMLEAAGLEAVAFDWRQVFLSNRRGEVEIATTIKDPGQMSSRQLRYLREKKLM